MFRFSRWPLFAIFVRLEFLTAVHFRDAFCIIIVRFLLKILSRLKKTQKSQEGRGVIFLTHAVETTVTYRRLLSTSVCVLFCRQSVVTLQAE